MSKLSRDKGLRIEREIIALHKQVGIHCERVPLSGQMHYRDGIDVDVYAFGRAMPPLLSEVKCRGNGEGFKLIERWLGDDSELLFLRRDRAPPLILMPWVTWAGVLDSIRR